MKQAKQLGFEDRQIAKFLNSNEVAIRRLRKEQVLFHLSNKLILLLPNSQLSLTTCILHTMVKILDVDFNDHGVMVLGSGVYRIGSSVEFDWCAVTAIRTLSKKV